MSGNRTVRVESVQIDDVDVFILRLENSPNGNGGFENKLNDEFLTDFNLALDEVEKKAKGGPAALVTVGKGKHYSDGLDLTFVLGLETNEDKIAFLKRVELLFHRLLVFPMPTIAAVSFQSCSNPTPHIRCLLLCQGRARLS